jgi:signal transduction histidine kinase
VTSAELPRSRALALLLFEAAVIIPTCALIASLLAFGDEEFHVVFLLWSVLIGLVELLPVPAWRGLTVSVGFPLLVMVAILYPPGVAGLITLLGASDPREFRREISFIGACFNRCQVALSVIAASAVFHAVAGQLSSSPPILVLAASLAAIADYFVNGGLVTLYMTIRLGVSPLRIIRELKIGSVSDFLISYLGLGVLGLTLAKFFESVGAWSIPAYLAPLLLARQVFFRSKSLEEAHQELKEREQVLRELSNTMAEERADERLQIAGYLHDDLAQVLFRLSLQVDIARKLLDKNDLDALEDQLEKIRGSKQETSDRIRALIRDLHRSPLGAKGLAEAFESFVDEVASDSDVKFHLDVDQIDLPAPIALLLYHIGREGVMNSLKHAQATDFWIAVHEDDDDIVLRLRDNGRGFDTSAPGPEGHFGMAMMRERAQVGGGTCEVQSEPGLGTTITVRFRTALLQRDQQSASEPTTASAQGHASPGTPGTTPRTVEDSRDSVHA